MVNSLTSSALDAPAWTHIKEINKSPLTFLFENEDVSVIAYAYTAPTDIDNYDTIINCQTYGYGLDDTLITLKTNELVSQILTMIHQYGADSIPTRYDYLLNLDVNLGCTSMQNLRGAVDLVRAAYPELNVALDGINLENILDVRP